MKNDKQIIKAWLISEKYDLELELEGLEAVEIKEIKRIKNKKKELHKGKKNEGN